jgi:hypothetical protein
MLGLRREGSGSPGSKADVELSCEGDDLDLGEGVFLAFLLSAISAMMLVHWL